MRCNPGILQGNLEARELSGALFGEDGSDDGSDLAPPLMLTFLMMTLALIWSLCVAASVTSTSRGRSLRLRCNTKSPHHMAQLSATLLTSAQLTVDFNHRRHRRHALAHSKPRVCNCNGPSSSRMSHVGAENRRQSCCSLFQYQHTSLLLLHDHIPMCCNLQ